MRALIAPTPLVTLALAASLACGTDRVTHPSPAAARAAAENAARALPVRGSCEATSTEVLVVAPPMVHQRSTARCRTTHLGRTTVLAEQAVNTATGALTQEATWTTANGDLVYATSVGTSTPTGPGSFDFGGVTTIVGGTGRFVGASGELQVQGRVEGGAGSFTYEGWMRYGAAGRSGR